MMKRNFWKKAVYLLSAVVLMTAALGITSLAAEEKDYRIDQADWTIGGTDESGYGDIRLTWEILDPDSKTQYEVRLYKQGVQEPKLLKRVEVGPGGYDCTNIIASQGQGYYYYTVKPLKGSADLMITSVQFHFTPAIIKNIQSYLEDKKMEQIKAEAARVGWIQDSPGGGWKYKHNDGTYASSGFELIGGKWYAFGSDAVMLTGWQALNGKWYYFGSDGAMLANTVVDGYQLGPDGDWQQNGVSVPAENSTSVSVSTGDVSEKAAGLTTVTIYLLEGTTIPGKIKEITLKNTGSYDIAGITYSVPFEQWTVGTPVSVSFQLIAKSGYFFAQGAKYQCNSAAITTNTGDERQRKIVLKYVPKCDLAQVAGVHLTEDGELRWIPVKKAEKYSVQIYRLGDRVENSNVSTAYCQVSDYLDDSNISIRIMPTGGKTSRTYLISPAAYVIDDLQDFAVNNTFPDGELKIVSGRPQLKTPDGKAYSGWKEIGGQWFLFDKSGKAVGPGWYQTADGNWYYFEEQYRMKTGTFKDVDGQTYKLNDGTNTSVPLGAWIH